MCKAWLSSAALILAAASYAWAVPPGDASAGKIVYTKSCMTCHGPSGEGKPAIGKMLHTAMIPLGSKEVQAKTDADLKKFVTEGVGKMPPVKGLSAKQMDDVIAYVRVLGKK
jgi:mono/diheme cytochrome c family protein